METNNLFRAPVNPESEEHLEMAKWREETRAKLPAVPNETDNIFSEPEEAAATGQATTTGHIPSFVDYEGPEA